jgi:pimeloyl-ACP methyl ester carboxylesterase
MPEIELSAGVIEYEDTGTGPVVVLVHGALMDGGQWRHVVAELSDSFRCVVPTLPLGAHRRPMRSDADLSLRGHAALIAEFLEKLDLSDVTLTFNDWCAAQLLVADGHTSRIARLVLVSVETDDNYPPGLPGRILALSGRAPGGLALAAHLLRIGRLQRLPLTFGRMSKRPIPPDVISGWLAPLRAQRLVRRDVRKYVTDTRRGRADLIAANARLATFERPVLVAWGADDRVMPVHSGRRLAAAFPRSSFIEIADSATLVPWDQPATLASAIRNFARSSTTGSAEPVGR